MGGDASFLQECKMRGGAGFRVMPHGGKVSDERQWF